MMEKCEIRKRQDVDELGEEETGEEWIRGVLGKRRKMTVRPF